jgi:hypothetical protein
MMAGAVFLISFLPQRLVCERGSVNIS